MQLPLRLRIRPSATLQTVQTGGHVLMGMPVLFWGDLLPVLGVAVCLLCSCLFAHRRIRAMAGELVLHADGTLERVRQGADTARQRLGAASRYWHILVALQLPGDGWLLLVPDSCTDANGWRLLQTWLRWAATATPPPNEISSGAAE